MLAAEKEAASGHPARLMTAGQVRQLLGGISEMTLWRWRGDEALRFPKPLQIQGRNFWRESEILAWLDAQAVA